ncbi:MAG: hypothetical protein WBV61_08100, partial [Rhodanobacteraceae bacterium]
MSLDWLSLDGAWASLGAVADVKAIDLHSPQCHALLQTLRSARPGTCLDFSSAFAAAAVRAGRERVPGMVRTMNAAENATPEANARFMFARIVPSQIGSSPFRITRKSRIFMHPLSHHMIRAEFDLSGIANLTLAPQINPLRGSCATRRDTGIVGVRLSIDGRPLGPRFIVDR